MKGYGVTFESPPQESRSVMLKLLVKQWIWLLVYLNSLLSYNSSIIQFSLHETFCHLLARSTHPHTTAFANQHFHLTSLADLNHCSTYETKHVQQQQADHWGPKHLELTVYCDAQRCPRYHCAEHCFEYSPTQEP